MSIVLVTSFPIDWMGRHQKLRISCFGCQSCFFVCLRVSLRTSLLLASLMESVFVSLLVSLRASLPLSLRISLRASLGTSLRILLRFSPYWRGLTTDVADLNGRRLPIID